MLRWCEQREFIFWWLKLTSCFSFFLLWYFHLWKFGRTWKSCANIILRVRSFGIFKHKNIFWNIFWLSGYSAPGSRIAGMEIQVFWNENTSQTNAYSHYPNYSYSGLIPNECPLNRPRAWHPSRFEITRAITPWLYSTWSNYYYIACLFRFLEEKIRKTYATAYKVHTCKKRRSY